jgi:hypothetical protein
MQGQDRSQRKQELLARLRFVVWEVPQLVAEALSLGLPSESPELIAAERALADWLKAVERSWRAE